MIYEKGTWNGMDRGRGKKKSDRETVGIKGLIY